MKRFLVFSISLLLVLSLVACQRNETSTNDSLSSHTAAVNENQTIKSESVGSQVTESIPDETKLPTNTIKTVGTSENTVSQNSVTGNKADGSKTDANKPVDNNPTQAPSGTAQEDKASSPSSPSISHEEEPAKDVRIRLTFNNRKIIVKMNDNPTSRDLVKKLPLKLSFKDYSGTEKISYLPQKLSTEGSPSGYDPSVGELAYYAPWGNICFYYHDFGYSTGVVPLGSIESGMESLTSIDGDFTVAIEKY
ncbi:cyclophilin-like fold protein [Desulfosporosinus nitroreducens]|uniref:cyclophilin-like fold protein n=1 Tax=Desulfosporosinus nitroreducens TaxID=2018668 RepID=UPI00207D2444|nr:cyclophilin-like fold protein [Desulfosporosinus nitroreducens]MCO1603753.1 cyclophilin-like fold protein [Desulfosporosinus nitroreducens]